MGFIRRFPNEERPVEFDDLTSKTWTLDLVQDDFHGALPHLVSWLGDGG
jgi:hypothetical protein